jgi:hypothetical protein
MAECLMAKSVTAKGAAAKGAAAGSSPDVTPSRMTHSLERTDPGQEPILTLHQSSAADTFAIVTPSYRGDRDRCRLLCDSVDRFVANLSHHYLLVEDRDVALFRELEGPRRRIIPESALLPGWLRSWPDPLARGRRVWTGAGALARGLMPLRGWHAQQLRKLAVATAIPETVLLFADSDVVFLRAFDLASQVGPAGTRLYRVDDAIGPAMAEHRAWLASAAAALGIQPPALPTHDYINNLITWRADHARALLAHVETATGRHWVTAVARRRAFSEWLLYGLFVDRVLGAGSAHVPDGRALAHTYWFKGDITPGDLAREMEALPASAVAIGVQSFIEMPTPMLRGVFERFSAGG